MKPFNFTILATFVAVLSSPLISAAAQAGEAGNFTANVAFTSDYVFRGISQSNEEPTIQGGFDWAHPDTGLYLGVWGSGVDFNDATTEIDLYGGIGGSVDKLSWKAGGIYYYYPGADDSLNYDFAEIAVSVGYDFEVAQATVSVNYSPNYFGDSGDAWYPSLNVVVPLPKDFSAEAHAAYQAIDDNAAFGVEDYTDWSLGLNYAYEGFNFGLKYIGTDLDEPSECADGCGDRVVFTVSRSF